MIKTGAIVLAGGNSTRMGRDKSLLDAGGVPLIQRIVDQLRPHVESVLISTNTPAAHAFLGLPMVADRVPNQGPAMGLCSALAVAAIDWNLVVATDMADLPLALLPELYAHTADHRCVVPRSPDGRYEPFFSLYHRSLSDRIWSLVDQGERRMQRIVPALNPAVVPVAAGIIQNLNTPDDLKTANFSPCVQPSTTV